MKLLRKEIETLPENLRPFAYHFRITDDIKNLIYKGMIDRNRFEFEINLKGESVILTKGESFRFGSNEITVITPLGVKLKIPYSVFNSIDYDDIINIISGYFVCNVNVNYKNTRFGSKSEYVVNGIKTVSKKIDTEEAKKLIENSNPIKALLDIFGYQYDEKMAYLLLIRMFPIVSNSNIIQLTLTNTGKTFFSYRVADTFNFYYSTTGITEAKLIYNSVTNTYGIVYTKNGLIIDEVFTVKELRSMEENILSGMENGIWTKSSGKVINLPIRKIPIIFFGNLIGNILTEENSRVVVGDLLKSELKLKNVNAFLDRIAITDIFTLPINANSIVKDYCYSNSTLAGWVELIKLEYQRKLKETEIRISDYKSEISIGGYRLSAGRMLRYTRQLKAYLMAVLGKDLVPSDEDLFNAICGSNIYSMLNLKPLLEDSNNPDNQNDDSNYNSETHKYLLDTERKILSIINDYGGQVDIDVISNETGLSKGIIYNTLYSLENKGMITLEGKTVKIRR